MAMFAGCKLVCAVLCDKVSVLQNVAPPDINRTYYVGSAKVKQARPLTQPCPSS
jgi:hypothetical protein